MFFEYLSNSIPGRTNKQRVRAKKIHEDEKTQSPANATATFITIVAYGICVYGLHSERIFMHLNNNNKKNSQTE